MAVVAAMTEFSARRALAAYLNVATTNLTVNSVSTTTLTASAAHGLINGDIVRFVTTAPTSAVVAQPYYVVGVTTAALTTFSISATLGGSAISLSGTGPWSAVSVLQTNSSPYLYLVKTVPTTDTGTGLVMATFTYTAQQLPAFTVGTPSSGTDFQRAYNSVAVNFSITGTGDTCSGILVCRNNLAAPTASDFLATATSNPVLYYGDFTTVTLNSGDTLSFAIGGTGAATGIAIDQY
jgi:hypothetical protein